MIVKFFRKNGIALRCILIVAVFLLLPGCNDSSVIWSGKSISPDSRWIATARTDQNGGPGTASVQTTVYLGLASNPGHEIEVLGLSNESAYPAGITSVKMIWISPTHLDITYGEKATLEFQAVQYAGITISVKKI